MIAGINQGAHHSRATASQAHKSHMVNPDNSSYFAVQPNTQSKSKHGRVNSSASDQKVSYAV
jgi:hypothetical protein